MLIPEKLVPAGEIKLPYEGKKLRLLFIAPFEKRVSTSFWDFVFSLHEVKVDNTQCTCDETFFVNENYTLKCTCNYYELKIYLTHNNSCYDDSVLCQRGGTYSKLKAGLLNCLPFAMNAAFLWNIHEIVTVYVLKLVGIFDYIFSVTINIF